MAEKHEEITDLFSMFHDFDIIEAELNDEVLVLEIMIPWGSMWIKDDYEYMIKVELLGCKYFNCEYCKLLSQELIKVGDKYQIDSEKINTTNAKDLKDLALSVQKSDYIELDKYELYCDSENRFIEFATLSISANDYRIFDNANNEISLDTMKKWAIEWWKGIQKMGGEKKKSLE